MRRPEDAGGWPDNLLGGEDQLAALRASEAEAAREAEKMDASEKGDAKEKVKKKKDKKSESESEAKKKKKKKRRFEWKARKASRRVSRTLGWTSGPRFERK